MFAKLGEALSALVRRRPEERFAAVERSLAQGWSESAFEALRALAGEGHVAAQRLLGHMYEAADGVVQSLPDAVHWYRLAAAQGDLESMARLGLIYFIEPPAPAGLTTADDGEGGALSGALAQFFPHGVAVRQDFAESLKWNLLAAERDSAEAQARLGHQYALGLGTAADPAAAERWFTAAAAQGHAEGQLGLGLLHSGSYDTPPDLSRAAHWLGLAANQGNRIAQYGFGKLLLHGEGIERDPEAAIQVLERAAAQDYAPAMHLLGMIHWRGEGVAPEAGLAETWLRRAVVRGHREASCALAQLLLERPEDDGVEAAALLREQAESGNLRAAAALSELHAFGRGVPRDAKEAARWREISQSEDRPETLVMLASLHLEGISVDQDFAAAHELLRQAAEGGSVDALFNLGSLHRHGLGVPPDSAQAARYYREAAARGSTEAAFQLGLIYAETGEMQTHAAAIACFTDAARAGHERARTQLGLQLAAGVDGQSDPLAARPWMELAAQGGDAAAQAWLGDAHRLGLFGAEDFATAETWYRRAASQGHLGSILLLATAIDAMEAPSAEVRAEAFGLWMAAASMGDPQAQFQVGRCYRDGAGCAADLETAARWFLAAQDSGSEEARAALDALKQGAPVDAAH